MKRSLTRLEGIIAATEPLTASITGKGTTLKAALAYVQQHGKPGTVDKVLAAVDPDTRQLVSGIILPSRRIPIDHLVALCEAIDRVMGRGDLKLCWDIGRFAADFEVNMLHKVFLKVARLDYWFRIAGVTWRFYYSSGHLTPNMSAESGVLTLTDFYPISKAFCFRFGGWVQRVVELSNLHNVRMEHTACVLDGAPACEWTGRWSK